MSLEKASQIGLFRLGIQKKEKINAKSQELRTDPFCPEASNQHRGIDSRRDRQATQRFLGKNMDEQDAQDWDNP